MLRRIQLVFAVLWSLSGFSTNSVWADPVLEAVTIMTPAGPVVFSCEVMRTEEEREKGLMFRPYLPQMRGMLFDFGETRPVQMWMKDTPIPLDMVFIRSDGTIARIAENTDPLSERVIASGGPIRAVLEINGGLAAKFGIAPGETVNHALFQP
jgi:uncharacterized protein